MSTDEQDAELIEESTLGTVWNEHRDPRKPMPWDEHITVDRKIWTDRTFYTLACRRGADAEYCDLDHCRLFDLSPRQLEALLFHELCHIDVDDETLKPVLKAHDFTGFFRELKEYGAWDTELGNAKNWFAQATLWDGEGR